MHTTTDRPAHLSVEDAVTKFFGRSPLLIANGTRVRRLGAFKVCPQHLEYVHTRAEGSDERLAPVDSVIISLSNFD